MTSHHVLSKNASHPNYTRVQITNQFCKQYLETAQLFPPLHDFDLLLRQPIKLVHQRIDLPAGGFDLALQRGLLVRDLCRGQLRLTKAEI